MEYKDLILGIAEGSLENGFYENIPNAVYHKIQALSASGIKQLEISPAHYKAMMEEPFDPDVSLGSLAHLSVLEPEEFEKRVMIKDRSTAKEKLEASNVGKIITTPLQFERAQGIANAIKKHEWASHLLQKGKTEVSGFALDPGLGVYLKIRPDSYLPELGFIADLKTHKRGESDRLIEKVSYNLKYHWQACFYLYVNKLITGKEFKFVHVFIETEAPYQIRCRAYNAASMEKAGKEFFHLMKLYAECQANNNWECVDNEIKDLSLPNWAFGEDLI